MVEAILELWGAVFQGIVVLTPALWMHPGWSIDSDVPVVPRLSFFVAPRALFLVLLVALMSSLVFEP